LHEILFCDKKALAWLSIAENHLWKNVAITRYKYAYKLELINVFQTNSTKNK